MRVRLASLSDPDFGRSEVDLSDMMIVTYGRQNVCGKTLLTWRTSTDLKSNFVDCAA
jgi:hypothetical protein